MQGDGDVVRNVVGNQGRHADAEIGVHAVREFLADSFGLPLAGRSKALDRHLAGQGALLNRFFEIGADQNTIDVVSGNMDLMRIKLADLDHFFDLGNSNAPGLGAGGVEVVGGVAEDQVAGLVGLPGLDDGQVGDNALFKHIFLAVKGLNRFVLRQHRTKAGAGEKCRDTGAAGPQLFCQGALGGQFQFQLTT